MEIRAGVDLEKSGGIVIKISKLISRGVFIWNTLNRLDKLWVSKDYQSLVSYCNEVIAGSPKYYFDPILLSGTCLRATEAVGPGPGRLPGHGKLVEHL